MDDRNESVSNRLSTGITGLDEVLHGGLVPEQAYLVRGKPGTGKTTLGLHFLEANSDEGKQALFITLEESEQQLRRNGKAMGFNLQTITFLDLSPNTKFFTQVQTYDIFSPAEVERDPITEKIVEQVETLQPQRVFVDSITQFRYLATDAYQFRRQVVSFLSFLKKQGATVLFASEGSPEAPDADLQFISDGIINLGVADHDRTIRVSKFRGSDFQVGDHRMRITDHGIKVYPRLITPLPYQKEFVLRTIASGIPDLDEMLHGGLEQGSVTIISGPSGIGKTTLGIQYLKEAAGRGERAVMYLFEGCKDILLRQGESVNIPISKMVERGTLDIIEIEPLSCTPEEFAGMVRQEVEERKTNTILIDSLTGYRLFIQGENLVEQLYILCKYLRNMGVTTLMLNEVEAITGNFQATELGISYLADNILFLRYLEIEGELCKAIGVLKKRLSDFEKTLRELKITPYGIKIGKPLTNLRGILTSIPEFIDNESGPSKG